MTMPKRKLCCNQKPKMWARQYGYSDDDVDYMLKCRKCKKQTQWHEVELATVEEWNTLNKS